MSVLGEASYVVLRLLSGAAFAVVLCICYRVLRVFFQVYSEIFLLCSAILSPRWLTRRKNLRLTPYLCETADMDAQTLQEVFSFNMTAFKEVSELSGNKEKIFNEYKKALFSYTYAFLFRDRLDGSLRGTAMLGVDRREKYTTVKIGLAMFQTEYRGGPWLKLSGAYLCIRELLSHPFTPVYGVTTASSYKSYVVVQAHRECYPHYSKETPEIYKKVAEEFVADCYNLEEYDRETFIMRRRVGTMNDHVAPIYERHLQNPHIKFFNERNADWKKGDHLVTVWRVNWIDYVDGLIIMIKQFLSGKKGNISGPRGIGGGGNEAIKHAKRARRRTLKRGLTFQDMQAGLLSVKYSVYELGDEEGKEVPLGGDTASPRSPEDLNGVNFEF